MQVVRANIGIDKKLFWGIVGTTEFIYIKNLNNIIYYNYNVSPATGQLKGGPDNLFIYGTSTNLKNFSYIMVADNTNKGNSWNFTVQFTKPYSKGFQGSIAYSYGETKSLNDALSSQNSSQWRYVANVNGRNHLDLSRSNFDMGHRLMAFVGYKKEYAKYFSTGLSVFYDGVSGKPYSFVYSNSMAIKGEDGNDYALIWIPKDRSEINLVDWKNKNGNVVKTADQQWTDLDLRVLQDFYINVGNSRHTLQVTLDIFNVLNLLNKDWGVHRFVTNDSYKLVNIEKVDAGVPSYTYRGTTSQDQVSSVTHPASYRSGIDPGLFDRIEGSSPVLLFKAKSGKMDEAYQALLKTPHVQVWKSAMVPEKFHYGKNPRRLDFVMLADSAWTLIRDSGYPKSKGAHGYDPDNMNMRAIFYAAGPAFKQGYRSEGFNNIDLYPLISKILGLRPAEVDGTIPIFRN